MFLGQKKLELLKSLIAIAIHFNVLLACASLRAIEENALKVYMPDICSEREGEKAINSPMNL